MMMRVQEKKPTVIHISHILTLKNETLFIRFLQNKWSAPLTLDVKEDDDDWFYLGFKKLQHGIASNGLKEILDRADKEAGKKCRPIKIFFSQN